MVKKTSPERQRSSKGPPPPKRVSRFFKVENELGMHARAAASFVKISSRFRSEILVSKGSNEVNGKSIMGVLMLAAGRGSRICVTAIGEDASKALTEIGALIRRRFDEK